MLNSECTHTHKLYKIVYTLNVKRPPVDYPVSSDDDDGELFFSSPFLLQLMPVVFGGAAEKFIYTK